MARKESAVLAGDGIRLRVCGQKDPSIHSLSSVTKLPSARLCSLFSRQVSSHHLSYLVATPQPAFPVRQASGRAGSI